MESVEAKREAVENGWHTADSRDLVEIGKES